MSKKKKISIIICLIVAISVLIISLEHLIAWQDYRAILDFPAAEQVEVTVRDYQAGGEAVTLNQAQTRELLGSLQAESTFAGIGSEADGPITPEDHAYDVSISSNHSHHIFLLAENANLNRVYGDSFVIRLGDMPETVALLQQYVA